MDISIAGIILLGGRDYITVDRANRRCCVKHEQRSALRAPQHRKVFTNCLRFG
ncbi:hypothetical protein ACM61V_11860 [Sphingomonas sp. TX0543]|uniref:hypothetical protein n=1 Tax=unclassified Sphingomonas TaxID=196159 RepID=UPI00148537D4|nr:hypothetical protein [Sphingomonas sp. 3P27F8]